MDYTHLDEKIRFLVECDVDTLEKLYQVIGRDYLEKYRTSPYEESSRPLLRRLDVVCKYDTKYKWWGNIDYKPQNYLAKMALDDIERTVEYSEGEHSSFELVTRKIENGDIVFDEDLGCFRPSDESFSGYDRKLIRSLQGYYDGLGSYHGEDAFHRDQELREFRLQQLAKRKIVAYDEDLGKWVLRGLSPDYTWLDNMLVLKIIEGYDSLRKLWKVLGDEITERYPIVLWKWQDKPIPGLMLLDDRLGIMYRAGKIRLNETTRALEFRGMERKAYRHEI